MGSSSSGRWRRSVAALFALVALSCSAADDSSPGPAAPDEVPTDSVARAVEPVRDAPSVLDDPNVDPEGVIMAAVLLHSGGDGEAAVADGSFSQADIDAARAALADGSLDYLFE